MTPTLRRAAAKVGALAAETAAAAVKGAAAAASGGGGSADPAICTATRSMRQLHNSSGELRSQGHALAAPLEQGQVTEVARHLRVASTGRGYAAAAEPAQQKSECWESMAAPDWLCARAHASGLCRERAWPHALKRLMPSYPQHCCCACSRFALPLCWLQALRAPHGPSLAFCWKGWA